MSVIRPELEPLPARLQHLPIDARGYVVPWFVAWVDGAPEFRIADNRKWIAAVRESRCWVCGGHVGVHKTFAIGSMCAVNRTTSEPGCHRDCATWSAEKCPFLSRPHARRREDETIQAMKDNSAGCPIRRNPGVTLLWTTKQWRVFDDGAGKPLIRLGDPSELLWFCEGRTATRPEIEHSIETGLPFLREMAEAQDKAEGRTAAVRALDTMVARVRAMLPAA